MDVWQAMIWIIGGAVVFVVIRMLWISMFRAPETVSSIPPLSSATTPGSIEADGADGGDEVEEIWIEIDVEPLFPSSESSVVDLTSEQEPESRP